MYRSHRPDIQDDLSGKSCGPLTLRRLDWLELAVRDHFPALAENLEHDEAGLGQAGLLQRLGLREQIRQPAAARAILGAYLHDKRGAAAPLCCRSRGGSREGMDGSLKPRSCESRGPARFCTAREKSVAQSSSPRCRQLTMWPASSLFTRKQRLWALAP